MTVALILLLAIVGLVLFVFGKRSGGVICAILSVLVAVLAGTGVIARPAIEALQSGYGTSYDHWGQRNTLVLLGVGTARTPEGGDAGIFAFGRIAQTAELYLACKAAGKECRVIVSGGKGDTLDVAGQSAEAPLYAKHLERLGVAHQDVVLESTSRNTWENAKFSCALLKSSPSDRVLLVSSAVHLKRSQLYFGHFCGQTDGVRADYLDVAVSAIPISLNMLLSDVAIHEYASLWRFRFAEAMGTNERPNP